MKKLFTLLSFVGILANADAQWCGSVGACTPNASTPAASFNPSYDNIPCVTKGQAYNQSISFKIPKSVTQPQVADIDSISFYSISNLPCGLCWKVNKASKHYAGDSLGCITISGVTSDSVGQYTLDIQFLAWLTGGNPASPTGPVSSELANLPYYLRVVATSGSACNAVNTSLPGNTAKTGCPINVGISDVNKDIRTLAVSPNPMNNMATLSFTSENAGAYSLNVVDILGKVISAKTIAVAAGENEIAIERNAMPEGVYFLQITNGKSFTTTKFVIAD